jgi:hypothetical protein
MVADNTNTTDKTLDRSAAGAHTPVGAALVNASLKDCRDAATTIKPTCTAELNQLIIASPPVADNGTPLKDIHLPAQGKSTGQGSSIDKESGLVDGTISNTGGVEISKSTDATHRLTNGILVTEKTMARSTTAIKNVEDYLTAPDTTPQDKLKSAGVLAANGINEVKGTDGTSYKFDINHQNIVTLKTTDSSGHIFAETAKLSADGNQIIAGGGTDASGAGRIKGKDHHTATEWLPPPPPKDEQQQKPETKPPGTEWLPPPPPKDEHQHRPEAKPTGTDWLPPPPPESDKIKLHGTTEQLKQLDASRERLKKDAAENIRDPQERAKFTRDMEAFEKRAKSQPLSAREISETYDQLSKLLEAKDGAVPKEYRVLAAETFAHHMGNPRNIDQGFHQTCSMTALEERLITRNPSKAAEIIATMAVTGHWKAPDGKIIKITPGSLVLGAEERVTPPYDGERSYATQLMNLALINDVDQRKIPPEFYSQEMPTDPSDTGERLKYADGTDVTNNDILHNGDKSHYNKPDVTCSDISQEGQSINGEGQFFIANGREDSDKGVVHVRSQEDLRRTLKEMKAKHKLPAIIFVDGNSPSFGGDPLNGPGWHVVSITDYDESTGKVHISNQWGEGSYKDMTL